MIDNQLNIYICYICIKPVFPWLIHRSFGLNLHAGGAGHVKNPHVTHRDHGFPDSLAF